MMEKKKNSASAELLRKKRDLKEASDLALLRLHDELETSKHKTERLVRNTVLIAGGLTLSYLVVRLLTNADDPVRNKKDKAVMKDRDIHANTIHSAPPVQAAFVPSLPAASSATTPGLYSRLGNEVLMIAMGVLKDRLIDFLKKQLNDNKAGAEKA